MMNNPLADMLGLSKEEAARVFSRAQEPAPDFEAEPRCQFVVLRFATEEQRIKAANRILDTGRLKVKISIDP
jgi:hypothetical protein